jgi:hypothetical protein
MTVMGLHWSDDLTEISSGLDILGIRNVDQGVELKLVNGITTISQRARYLSILTWALGEFLTRNASSGYTESQLKIFLSRVEFLVLTSTYRDSAANNADTYGTLGSTRFEEALSSATAGNPTPFPDEKGGGMLGTYLGPCRATGLLINSDEAAGPPYRLTPRGNELWQIRCQELGDFDATSRLLGSDTLLPGDVEQAIPGFSLNRLSDAAGERTLLKSALTESWGSPSDGAYQRFNDTVSWISDLAESAADNAGGFLARNLQSATQGANGPTIVFAWAEYEYRRRCHFALELVLSAVTETLGEFAEASVHQLVSRWESRYETAELIRSLVDISDNDWGQPAQPWLARIPENLFAGEDVPRDAFTALSAENRIVAAMMILTAMGKQTRTLRNSNAISPLSNGLGDRVIEAIEAPREIGLNELIEETVRMVVLAHLETTLRKMGAGQKCSLRFFPDGDRLRPTGLSAGAGQSGDRLTNVMRFLTDVGQLTSSDRKFAPAGMVAS